MDNPDFFIEEARLDEDPQQRRPKMAMIQIKDTVFKLFKEMMEEQDPEDTQGIRCAIEDLIIWRIYQQRVFPLDLKPPSFEMPGDLFAP